MKDILIIGCGGHAKSIIEIINKEEWNIVGIIGQENEKNRKILNYKVIGTDNDIELLRKKYSFVFVAIGQIGSSNKRRSIIKNMKNYRFSFPIIKSKYSIVSSDVTINSGTSIGHGVIINPGAKIDDHCIINTKSLLEHDVEIGKYCHISTGVIINGGVKIGNNSFIGSGAIIREGLEIPPNSVISAGKRVMGWPIMDV